MGICPPSSPLSLCAMLAGGSGRDQRGGGGIFGLADAPARNGSYRGTQAALIGYSWPRDYNSDLCDPLSALCCGVATDWLQGANALAQAPADCEPKRASKRLADGCLRPRLRV